MNCPRCGEPVSQNDARFCMVCGASLPRTPVTDGPRCPVHPDLPAAEICARCGSFACKECLRHGENDRPLCAKCFELEKAATWAIPWENRKQLGRMQAFWRTLQATAFNPKPNFSTMAPTTGRWWDPLSYVLVAHIPLMIGAVLLATFVGWAAAVFNSSVSNGGLGLNKLVATLGVGALVLILVGVPLFALARVFVIGGLEHLALVLFGAAKHPFEATLRAHCYAAGPLVFVIIPGCGLYASEALFLVLRILGFMGVHKTSGGLATAAALIPAVLCIGGPLLLSILAPALLGSFGQ